MSFFSSHLLKNLHYLLVFDEEWILTAEEIFQEEVYKIAMYIVVYLPPSVGTFHPPSK